MGTKTGTADPSGKKGHNNARNVAQWDVPAERALLRRRQARPPEHGEAKAEGNAQKGSERGETGFWLRVECIGAP